MPAPGTSYDTLTGDFIGTDPTGKLAADSSGVTLGNSGSGVEIDGGATHNTIATSVSSNNGQDGVFITGAGTDFNLLAGDYIGTDVTGTNALANGNDGVVIIDGATSNTVGGTTAGARDVISGNAVLGVDISGSGTSATWSRATTSARRRRHRGLLTASTAWTSSPGRPPTRWAARRPVPATSSPATRFNGVVLGYSGTSDNVVEGRLHRHRPHRHRVHWQRPGRRRHHRRRDRQHDRRDDGRGAATSSPATRRRRADHRLGHVGQRRRGRLYRHRRLPAPTALGNGHDGVDIVAGATSNTVGGTTAGAATSSRAMATTAS